MSTLYQAEFNSALCKFLKIRQNLLVQYTNLGKQQPFNEMVYIKPRLTYFCETLMDYLSFGQFKIFLQASNHDPALNCQLNTLNLDLSNHLEFNDKYRNLNNLPELKADLSLIGEKLADRINIEDSILKQYLKNNF